MNFITFCGKVFQPISNGWRWRILYSNKKGFITYSTLDETPKTLGSTPLDILVTPTMLEFVNNPSNKAIWENALNRIIKNISRSCETLYVEDVNEALKIEIQKRFERANQ